MNYRSKRTLLVGLLLVSIGGALFVGGLGSFTDAPAGHSDGSDAQAGVDLAALEPGLATDAEDEDEDEDEDGGELESASSHVEISNVDELQAMEDDLGADYVLVDDIDASETADWNDGAGFEPIGGDFEGSLDGQNYTISNLTIDRSSESEVGLFGELDPGEVRNLYFEHVDITGDDRVGALAARTNDDDAHVENVHVLSGTVTGNDDEVGGLIGYARDRPTIHNTSAHVAVESSGDMVGGLVGRNRAAVTDSYATGNVTGGEEIGGFVGYHRYGWIERSFATGDADGTEEIGGFAGRNREDIYDSYATGDVEGDHQVGGFVGRNYGADEWRSYSVGNVSSAGDHGGFAGRKTGDIHDSYYNIYAAAVGVDDGDDVVTALYPEEMQSETASASMSEFDFDGEWFAADDRPPLHEWFVDDYELSVNETEVVAGESVSATVALALQDGTSVTATEPATVSAGDGLGGDGPEFTADAPGESTITASTASLSDDVTVTVTKPDGFFVAYDEITEPEAGGTLSVDATVENTLDETATQDVSLTVDDVERDVREDLTLDGGETAAIALDWETTADDAGDYEAAVASDDHTNTTAVSVAHLGDFAITIDGTNDPVDAGDAIEVTSTVENVGDQADTQDVTLETDGRERDAESVSLDPDESETITLTWETRLDDAGEYEATVSSGTDANATDVTVEGPIPVENVRDLREIEDDLGADYVLANDIDATGFDDFEPIGGAFSGSLDGQNDTISNLTIDRPTESQVGLFRELEDGATVEDLSLENASITGNDRAGALAGLASDDATRVENVHVLSGTVDGNGDEVGGLIGYTMDQSTIHNTSAHVTVESSGDYVGGSIGRNRALVTDSYATGDVDGGLEVGGFVGYHRYGWINQSFATGDVDGTEEIGGFAGRNREDIFDSYATGNVTGDDRVGGFVGRNYGSEEWRSYAVGEVSSPGDHGGFAGRVTGDVYDSYYYENAAAVGVDDGDGDVTALSWAELTGENASSSMPAFDFETDWIAADEDAPLHQWFVTGYGVGVDESEIEVGDTTTAAVTLDLLDGSAASATEPANFSIDGSSLSGDGPTFTGEESGESTITASASGLSDDVSVTVLEPAHLDVVIDDTNQPVVETETVQVTATVENTGERSDEQTVSLDVDGQRDETQVALDGGESEQISLEWTTGEGDAGTYEAVVASDNATDQTSVEVLERAFFDVEIDEVNEPVEGEELVVTTNVTNTGEEDGVTQSVTLNDTGWTDQVQDSTEVTLDGDENVTVDLTWATQDGDAKTDDVTVSSDDDSVTQEVTILEKTCETVSYDGSGTSADPWRVSTVKELQCMGSASTSTELDGDFRQTADINATETQHWNDGDGFDPIGWQDGFEGIFDGDGYTIEDLYIDRSDSDWVGLFAWIEGAEVRNVDLRDVDVTGNSYVGGLIGEAYNGEVEPSTIEDNVVQGSVSGVDYVGGMIGLEHSPDVDNDPSDGSLITNSKAHVNVTGTGEGEYVGGFIGWAESPITESGATGDVTAPDHTNVGGFLGSDASDKREIFATGDVEGEGAVGGLTGYYTTYEGTSPTYEDTYATGNVTGNEDVGGLVGLMEEYSDHGGIPNVENSWAVGEVSGPDSETGGIVGTLTEGGFSGSYFDTEASDQSDASSSGSVSGVTGLTTDQMTGTDASGNMDALDFSRTWDEGAGPDEYPVLQSQPAWVNTISVVEIESDPVAGGGGETNDVTYQVLDGGGEPIEGEPVSFTIDSGDGSLNRTSGETNAAGNVSVEYTTDGSDDGSTVKIEGEAGGETVIAPFYVYEEAFFDVETTDWNEPVEGEELVVTANVTNTGEEDGVTQTISLNDTDWSDEVADTVDVTLDGGESNDSVELTWQTSVGENGTGDVTVSSEDDSETQDVTVLEEAFFAVEITDWTEPVEGEELVVTANVTNTGEEDGVTQTITLNDTAWSDQVQDSADVTLDGGESSDSVQLTWSTDAGDNATGEVTVSSQDDSAIQEVTILEQSVFDVEIDEVNEPVEGEDLVVTTNVTNTGEEDGVTQSVTLNDTGWTDQVQDSAEVSLDGGENQTIDLTWATQDGDATTDDVTVASDDDSVTHEVTILEQAFFDVEITDWNEPVEGEELVVTANVTNTGEEDDATQTITLNDTDWSDEVQDSTEVTLDGGESNDSVQLIWDTDAGDAETGTVTVFSEDDSDAREVTVLEEAFFDVEITDWNEPVEGDELEVTANVTNTGEEDGVTQSVTLNDTDWSDEVQDSTDVTLDGGESNDSVELRWATEDGQNGTDEITVYSEDDSAIQEITVLEQAHFDVEITDWNEPVEGEDLVVTANVTNTGEEDGVTQSVTLNDTGWDDQQRDSVDVTLDGGEWNDSVELVWNTTLGDAGTGDVTVSSDDDSDTQSVTILEEAYFDVEITNSNEPVVEGNDLEVTANVTNTGDVEGTEAIELYDDGWDTDLQDSVDVTLGGGEHNDSVTLTWSTDVGENATADVLVNTDSGEWDSKEVTVLEKASFDVEITDVTEPVEGDDLVVTANVTNTGEVDGATQTISLTDTDWSNSAQDSAEVTLNGGESNESVQLTWATEVGQNGTGDVTVASEDDSVAQTVRILEQAFFDVEITDWTEPVEGDELVVTANVTNTGEEDGVTQSVTLNDTGWSDQVQDSTEVTLDGGENQTVDLTWSTQDGDADTDDVTVSTDDDSAVQAVTVLDQAFFDVEITDWTEPVEGEELVVTANVTNTGDVSDTQSVTLNDTGWTDSVQDSVDLTLDGGQSDDSVELRWATEEGQNGTDDVTVTSEDDQDTQEVSILTESAFTVEITDWNDPVEGEDLLVTANVTNTGDEAATQTITLNDTGWTDSVQDTVDVTLDGGQSDDSVELRWATEEGQNATDDVTVYSEDDSALEQVTIRQLDTFEVAIDDAIQPVAGDTLQVDATVENVGDVEGTQTISLDVGGQRDATDVTLDGGQSQQVTLEWETDESDAGSYTATVESDDDSDQTAVTVLEPAFFDVEIDDWTEPVEGEELVVTANVTNTGEEDGATQSITLNDTGWTDSVQDSAEVTLDGGGNQTVDLVWTTQDGDANTDEVTVASEDDSTIQEVTILEQAFFDVEIDAIDETVDVGESVQVEATVTNTGGVTETQEVTLEVNGSVGEVDSETITLEAAESTAVDTTWDTTDLDAGDYLATMASADDDASAIVTLEEPTPYDVSVTTIDGTATANGTDELAYEITVSDEGDPVEGASVQVDHDGTSVELPDGESLVTGSDGTVTFTATSTASQNLTVTVTDDEWNETATASGTFEPGDPASVDATVTDDEATADGDDSVTFTALVTDAHENPVPEATVSVESGHDVAQLGGIEAGDNASTDADGQVTFTATATDAGEYTVGFTASEIDANDIATATFESESVDPGPTPPPEEPDDDAELAVVIDTLDEHVVEGDPIEVTASVENVGETNATDSIELTVDGEAQDASEVTLEPGAVKNVTLQWTEPTPGNHTVTVSSEYDSASASIVVAAADTAVSVTVTDARDPVTVGEDYVVTATVTNEGQTEFVGDAAMLVDRSLATTESNLTVPANDTAEVTLRTATTEADLGDRTLGVAVASGMDEAAVTVVDADTDAGTETRSPTEEPTETDVEPANDTAPSMPEWTDSAVDYEPSPQSQHVGAFLWLAGLLWALGLWVLLTRTSADGTLLAATVLTGALRASVDVVHVTLDAAAGLQTALASTTVVLEVAIGLLFLQFAASYAGASWATSRRVKLATVGAFGLAVAVTASNGVHGLVFTDVATATEPFVHVTTDLGPIGWLLLAANAALLVTGAGVIVQSLLQATEPALRPVGVIVAGVALAVVVGASTLTGRGPLPQYDYNAVAVGGFLLLATVPLVGHGLQQVQSAAKESLLAELGDPVVVLDDAHRVVEYNGRAEALVGSIEVGRSIDDLLATPLEFPTGRETVTIDVAGEDLFGGVQGRADGTDPLDGEDVPDSSRLERHYQLQITPVIAPSGERLGHAVRFADVTELVEKQAALERKNDQIERFTGTLSHDLRNPLNVAEGYLDMVQDAFGPDADQAIDPASAVGFLTEVDESLDRMYDIMDDIQVLTADADAVAAAAEPVPLADVVGDAWASVETGNATLDVDAAGRIEADPSRLQRLLENLFRNAVEHGSTSSRPSADDAIEHGGSSVTVTVELTGDGFAVADDGPGIPDDVGEQVFDEGYTTGGTGLGLSIVTELADAHGWNVELDTSHDGARFVFTDCVIDRESPVGTGADDSGDDTTETPHGADGAGGGDGETEHRGDSGDGDAGPARDEPASTAADERTSAQTDPTDGTTAGDEHTSAQIEPTDGTTAPESTDEFEWVDPDEHPVSDGGEEQ